MSSKWFTIPDILVTKGRETTNSTSSYQIISLSLVAAVTLIVVYNSFQNAKKKRAEVLFVKTHGCGTPPRLEYKWPLAIDIVVEAFSKMAEKQTLQWFVGVFEKYGATFEQHVLGTYDIDTVEPANLESILSSNFSSYCFGARGRTFAPLLGDGIFTQEGAPWKHSRDMLRPLFSLNQCLQQ